MNAVHDKDAVENRADEISENTGSENTRRSGGLYAKVNMSVRSANIMVACLVLALVIVTAFVVSHNGFTVKFDTDGGSQIEPQKVFHSQLVTVSEAPVKEGYVFTGWYTDRDCTNEWNLETDTVSGSMTLYAGWQAKQG